MKNIIKLIIVSLLTYSCASTNLSKNIVREGDFLVKNGVFADKKWEENLIFKRLSWYHELTLQFDLLLAPVSAQSSFNFWFSPTEQQDIQKCSDFRVVLAYSLDTKLIPYSILNEQLELAGFKKVELFNFKKHLMVHPDSELNSLRLYQVYGICRLDKEVKPLILNFPGFTEKALN